MKKRKFKYKNIIIIFILLLIVLFPVKDVVSIKMKGYNFSNTFKIYFNGLRDTILKNDYSKTVEKFLDSDNFDKKYLNLYFEIDYYDNDYFVDSVNNLLNTGYTSIDINNINKKEIKELNDKLENMYVQDISNYLQYEYFKTDKIDRYVSYFNGDYSDTIVKVNIGLDKEFYDNPNIVKKYSTSVLVNKYNMLDASFEPTELVKIDKCLESNSEEYLASEAKKAYDLLCEASKKDKINIGVTSAYRSYEDQASVYRYYLKNNGADYASKYVAREGYSEHQTGLSLDIKSTVGSPFKTTKEYTWMINNAYKYGFILRYPEGKEDITGYNSESWHFRYVGVDIAKYIYENNITYDEYYAMFF